MGAMRLPFWGMGKRIMSKSEITVRPMEPEDWNEVSKIYLEGIATEHATFQTDCPHQYGAALYFDAEDRRS